MVNLLADNYVDRYVSHCLMSNRCRNTCFPQNNWKCFCFNLLSSNSKIQAEQNH